MSIERANLPPESGEDIGAALAQPWYRTRFVPRLELRFDRDTWSIRHAQIRFAFFIIAGLQVFLLLPDLQLGHAQFLRGLAVRIGFVIPVLLVASWLIVRDWPISIQGLTTILAVVVSVTGDTWIAQHSSGQAAGIYFTGGAMGIFFNNIIMPLRPKHAVFATLASLAAYDAFLLGVLGCPPVAQGAQVALNMSLFVLISLVFRWRNESFFRRTFLLTARDRLHGQQLAWANRQLTELSYTDSLTGLPNRRYFDEVLTKAWNFARDRADPLALLMIDVDHFKNFNDSLGHAAGDKCLQRIAHALQFSVRVEVDTVSRYGGEEFVAILPGASLDEALAIAGRVRAAIAALEMPHPSRPGGNLITVSVGVATCASAWAITAPDLLHAADDALYSAKSQGRDCVVAKQILPLAAKPAAASPATPHPVTGTLG
jgi:diguanylate cyclase (GGDEF)-like protein